MLHLPAPLAPSSIRLLTYASTNIELLLMLVTMLDIVKQENIPKSRSIPPLKGAQSTKERNITK